MTSRAVKDPASIEYSPYCLTAVATGVFIDPIFSCVFVHYAVHLGRITALTRTGLRTLA
jgi:hypothetical protein